MRKPQDRSAEKAKRLSLDKTVLPIKFRGTDSYVTTKTVESLEMLFKGHGCTPRQAFETLISRKLGYGRERAIQMMNRWNVEAGILYPTFDHQKESSLDAAPCKKVKKKS